MKPELYPLRFQPIFKDKIWGGNKLKKILAKDVNSSKTGESWEISAVGQDVSKVVSGALKGASLRALIKDYKEELIGKSVYKKLDGKFPLLFKFIDAKENLSLQLHPNDELAQKRHASLGKTEMWYVIQADPDAGIYVSFEKGTTKKDYLQYLEKDRIQEIMHFEKVKTGDVFFIKPGLVHAIGEGVLLAEIQQSSDITYRIFDWNRNDAEGNSRKLHVDLALRAIDFELGDYKIAYKNKPNVWEKLIENKYFKTQKINLSGNLSVNYSTTDSFVVLMCVGGEVTVKTKFGNEILKLGETILIPACLNKIDLMANRAELLEVTA